MKSMFYGTTILALLLLIHLPVSAEDPKPPLSPESSPSSKSAPESHEDGPGISIPTIGNEHISSLRAPHKPYNSKPPTS